jgi:pimeloyl-ACP methyl ester carboxylesterase
LKTTATVAAFIASLLAAPAAGYAEELDASLYAKPAQLVTVQGDRRLNFLCMGSGAPTVILEAGAGGYSTAWRKVQAGIAQFTRVCSYDRAGYGFSDPIARPSTAANYVADLHAALSNAQVRGPIVLVGHSAGGLYASLYADLHLSDLAGMVLLDPMLPGQGKLYAQFLSDQEAQRREKLLTDDKARRRSCASFAGEGSLSQHASECVRVPAGLSPSLAEVYASHLLQPKAYEASLAEDDALYGPTFDAASEDDGEETAAAKSFGDLPFLIMVAGGNERGPPEEAWRASVDRLAGRSTRGRVIVVPKSEHNIQLDQPDSVVGAVRDIVSMARPHR